MTGPLDIARLTEKRTNAELRCILSRKANSTRQVWTCFPGPTWWGEPSRSFCPAFVAGDREDYGSTAFDPLWEYVSQVQTGVV